MKLSFPAMRGRMGQRDYYVAMVKLCVVPKMFKFQDWAELPPEQRAQRVLTKSRIPAITRYILENEDGYLFSSLTASYNCQAEFRPLSNEQPDIGILEVPFEAEMVINDGQHRRAAIEEAVKQNPKLGEESISVVLFPFEGIDRVQQMFSDLNRTARTTSKSLNILYNHRDLLSQIVLELIETLDAFCELVDKDRVSLPIRSPKLFTLASIYDATQALLGGVAQPDFDDKRDLAHKFWAAVAQNLPEWGKVRSGELKPMELRQEFIHTHAVVLWAIGSMGQTLVSVYPDIWEQKLQDLRTINWRRTNKDWQGLAMQGSDVINRRQSRMDTASYLKRALGLPLTPTEERSLRGATDVVSVMEDLRKLVSTR